VIEGASKDMASKEITGAVKGLTTNKVVKGLAKHVR